MSLIASSQGQLFRFFRPHQHGTASKQAQVPKTNISNGKSSKTRYQRSDSAQYSGFKLAASTFLLSILEFIFTATSHKHYAFTITYDRFGNLTLNLNLFESVSPRLIPPIYFSLRSVVSPPSNSPLLVTTEGIR